MPAHGSINNYADVIETCQSIVDLDCILGIKAFDLAAVLQKGESFLDINSEHMHDASVTSVGIEVQGSLDLTMLNSWLTRLLQEKGVDIFRSKGVLNIACSDARYVFQGVHMLMGISSSDDGAGRGWKVGERRTNRLIFIGRNLNRAELEAKFRRCVASI